MECGGSGGAEFENGVLKSWEMLGIFKVFGNILMRGREMLRRSLFGGE